METYQLCVFQISNEKITYEIYLHQRTSVLKYKARDNLDDKEAPKY